jgi:molybdopterin-guanine dinucleotide biosynthesis protein A
MKNGPPVCGLVLAGGASRRFGSDKREAMLGGQSLLQRAVATMCGATSQVLLGAGSQRVPDNVGGVPIPDARPGCGPLGAIVEALGRVDRPLLVLACDAPLVRSSTLRMLAATTLRTNRLAALRDGERWQPLIACYPPGALRRLSTALREDNLVMHRLLTALDALPVVPPSKYEILNANRPADLDEIARFESRDRASRRS